MNVNLKETVKRAGVPLSFDYVNNHYGPDSGYTKEESDTQPLNRMWRADIRRLNKPFLFNLTDFSSDDLHKCLNELKKLDDVKFYGVFSIDYENNTNDGRKPTVVYAMYDK